MLSLFAALKLLHLLLDALEFFDFLACVAEFQNLFGFTLSLHRSHLGPSNSAVVLLYVLYPHLNLFGISSSASKQRET